MIRMSSSVISLIGRSAQRDRTSRLIARAIGAALPFGRQFLGDEVRDHCAETVGAIPFGGAGLLDLDTLDLDLRIDALVD